MLVPFRPEPNWIRDPASERATCPGVWEVSPFGFFAQTGKAPGVPGRPGPHPAPFDRLRQGRRRPPRTPRPPGTDPGTGRSRRRRAPGGLAAGLPVAPLHREPPRVGHLETVVRLEEGGSLFGLAVADEAPPEAPPHPGVASIVRERAPEALAGRAGRAASEQEVGRTIFRARSRASTGIACSSSARSAVCSSPGCAFGPAGCSGGSCFRYSCHLRSTLGGRSPRRSRAPRSRPSCRGPSGPRRGA